MQIRHALLLLTLAASAHADDPKPPDDLTLRLLMQRMSMQNERLQERVNELRDELEKAQRETKDCIEARTT